MNFTGKLGHYKIIQTDDDTQTVWSEYFDEACHNLSGAYAETIHNYIEGCKIVEQINQEESVHVLDVGFGMGVGLRALMNCLGQSNRDSHLNISYTSIELDPDFFLWTIKNYFQDIHFSNEINSSGDLVYRGEKNFIINKGELKLTISIFIGDGRKTLYNAFLHKQLPLFTAIFQDPFSPKKNPTLWTLEWFVFLKETSKKDVLMSTYSASISVRKTMLKAGWEIENSVGFGQKKSMTKANLVHKTSEKLLVELNKSPTLELRDK